MKRLLFVLAAAVLTACNLDVPAPLGPDLPSDPATETFDASLKIDLSKMTKLPSGVYITDIRPGAGDSVAPTSALLFHYAGFLKTGQTFATGQATSPIALTGLILGIQSGLVGMRVGGERLLVIPSALGFANETNHPGVPANSTLIYDLVLDGVF